MSGGLADRAEPVPPVVAGGDSHGGGALPWFIPASGFFPLPVYKFGAVLIVIAMPKKKKTTTKLNPVVVALRQVVADSYAVLGQTHICHWNVRGHNFFSLHTAFEAQYTELFTAIDEIAERIRALGSLAPGGLGNLAKMAGIKEIGEDTPAGAMVRHLVEANKRLVADLQKARDAAGAAKDAETEDLMIGRIQVHEKTIWMLESFLAA